jgi:hypothetical protein
MEYIEAHKQPNFTFRFQFECNSRDAIAALAHGYGAAAYAPVSFSSLPRQPPVFVGLKQSTNRVWGQTQTSMVIMLVDDDEPAPEPCEAYFADGAKRKRI